MSNWIKYTSGDDETLFDLDTLRSIEAQETRKLVGFDDDADYSTPDIGKLKVTHEIILIAKDKTVVKWIIQESLQPVPADAAEEAALDLLMLPFVTQMNTTKTSILAQMPVVSIA